jgi:hypothetical protein
MCAVVVFCCCQEYATLSSVLASMSLLGYASPASSSSLALNPLYTIGSPPTSLTSSAAWIGTPVRVLQGFQCIFKFKQADTASFGEGFALVLQWTPLGLQASGGGAGQLGYDVPGSSMAVEFDMNYNSGRSTSPLPLLPPPLPPHPAAPLALRFRAQFR